MDNSRRRIPGPAGIVADALHCRAIGKDVIVEGEEQPNTQEYVANVLTHAADDPNYQDVFSRPSWEAAMEFSNSRQFEQKTEINRSVEVTMLASLKPQKKWYKAEKIVAMIDSITPNGQGDFLITMKDPTGKIRASVHRSTVEAHGGAYVFKSGAVMVLSKVTVFHLRPSDILCVNIVDKNLQKIFDIDYAEGQHVTDLTAEIEMDGGASALAVDDEDAGWDEVVRNIDVDAVRWVKHLHEMF